MFFYACHKQTDARASNLNYFEIFIEIFESGGAVSLLQFTNSFAGTTILFTYRINATSSQTSIAQACSEKHTYDFSHNWELS